MVLAGAALAESIPMEVAPALHVYEVAPPAVNIAVCPVQIAGELTVIARVAATVTVDTAESEHVPVVPVTVNVDVEAGLAVAVFVPVEVAPALHV